MTLSAAIRKAEISGASVLYRISTGILMRSIRDSFTADEHAATDWQVYYPEPFIGHSGVE